MKALLYATLVLGLVAGSVQAGTVLVVSDCEVPGGAGADNRDDNLVAFLQGLGHTVDTSGMNKAMQEGQNPFTTPAKLAALQNADLVVVSRRTSSGSYDNNRKQWNELTTPLISMSGYLTRGETANKIWGWTSAGSGDATKTETDLVVQAGQAGHAFLSGLTGPVTLFDWSTVPAGDNQAPKVVYLPNAGASWSAGTAIIGTFDGRDMLVDIPSGTDLDALNGTAGKYGVTGARRGFFTDWGYDVDLGVPFDRQAQFDDFVTADYETVLTNMVGTLIPEPATLALLAAGAVATLIRRKK